MNRQLVTSNNKSNKHNGVIGKGFSDSFSKSSRFPVGFFRVFRNLNFLLQISQIFRTFLIFGFPLSFPDFFGQVNHTKKESGTVIGLGRINIIEQHFHHFRSSA
jgi:hypothetical protein